MANPIEPTISAIKQALDAAFVPAELDDDGDLKVKVDRFTGFLSMQQGAPILKVMYQFGSPHDTDSLEVLRAVNEFNKKYVLVKTYWLRLRNRGALRFEADLRVDGGVSPVALINTLRQVETILIDAKELHPFMA